MRLGLGRRASLPAHARTRTCPGSATAPGQMLSLAAGRSSLQDYNQLQTDVYSCIYCFHVCVAVPRRPKLCDQVSPSVPSAAPRRPQARLFCWRRYMCPLVVVVNNITSTCGILHTDQVFSGSTLVKRMRASDSRSDQIRHLLVPSWARVLCCGFSYRT